MRHKGSCHCGQVKFEAEGELGEVLACNCSMCERRGSLLWFVPRDRLVLSTPAADLSEYRFNRHAIGHRFCARCGIHVFGEANGPDGTPMAAVNARCLEDVDVSALKVKHFNGKAL
jgi:hypothetical protein